MSIDQKGRDMLAAERAAASAMLAALEAAADHVGVVRLQTGFDVRPIQDQVRDAIAAAKAAGIKAQS